jgi:hypothetical protein
MSRPSRVTCRNFMPGRRRRKKGTSDIATGALNPYLWEVISKGRGVSGEGGGVRVVLMCLEAQGSTSHPEQSRRGGALAPLPAPAGGRGAWWCPPPPWPRR